MQQLTQEQAIAFGQSVEWRNWTSEQIVRFQLFQDRLCVDFSAFHKAMEDVLGRPVFTHEFAYQDHLIKEYLGEKDAPTFDEIIGLIPEDKRVVILNTEA